MLQPLEIRRTIMQMCYNAGEGHIPSCFSVVEILTTLYEHVLKYQPRNPQWEDRDYFVLSKGQSAAALYAILAKKGFISEHDLLSFTKYESSLGGHPDRNKVPGIEASTGSLGHGFPYAAGIALGLKIKARPNRVYVLIGDGECNEGSIWETAMVASHRNLNNLIGILDFNQSTTRCLPLTNVVNKWTAFRWRVHEVDGHNIKELKNTFESISNKDTESPSMIIAHTTKGKGSRLFENDNFAWHHKIPTAEEYSAIMRELE